MRFNLLLTTHTSLIRTSPVVTSIYPGIFADVGVVRGIRGNLEPEETKGKMVEKMEGQEQEEAAV